MQNSFKKFPKPYHLKMLLLVGFIFLFNSCFYSAKYLATYKVQNNRTTNETKELAINYINQLAAKNTLIKDTKYYHTDTIGFFGQPYHYFKFWFEEKDKIIILKLDYKGSFGSRKNKPYKDLFTDLNTFMNGNFIVLEEDIKEENNSKK
jgi:hypothetical protein